MKQTIQGIRERWKPYQLPTDLRRLAQNIADLGYALRIAISGIWQILNAATTAGKGSKTTNLSPVGSILAALVKAKGATLFNPLLDDRAPQIFVPLDIDLPSLAPKMESRVIRPRASV